MLRIKNKTDVTWITDLVVLTIGLGFFYAIWLGLNALYTPDEGRYSEIAREMLASKDFITPRLNGVVFLDKPIFYYWLQVSAIYLFGLKEVALRFWPATLGVIGAAMTYVTGRALFDRRTGLLSALILATSPLYYCASHYANLDLEVAVLISLSLYFFLLGIQTQRTECHIAGYVLSGCAFLTKGLIGVFFPAAIVGLWIVIAKKWDTLKKLHLVWGFLIVASIVLPWYLLAQKANPQFLHFFFFEQQVSRFLTKGDFNNKSPIWFYLPLVVGGMLPWSVFALQAFTQKIKDIWRNRNQHSTELFLVLWFFVVLFFFSIPKSKTVGYILPIFPPLSLLVASYVSQNWNQTKTPGLIIGVVCFIILSIFLFALFLIVPEIKALDIPPQFIPYLRNISLICLGSGLLATYFLLRKKSFLPTALVLFTSSAIFLLMFIHSTSILNAKSLKPLALDLKPLLQKNDEVVAYFKYYQDFPVYLEKRVTVVADWTATSIPNKDNWIREMWYGMPYQDTSAWLINEKMFWQRWNSDKKLYVLVYKSDLADFTRKAGNRMKVVEKLHDVTLVKNS